MQDSTAAIQSEDST